MVKVGVRAPPLNAMNRMMTITRMHIRAMDLNLLPILAALFEAKSWTWTPSAGRRTSR
jgi:hypothetical protein